MNQIYRGLGLGKLLLGSILEHLDLKGIKNHELTCADDKVSFYEKFGFSKDYADSIPMKHSNPDSTIG